MHTESAARRWLPLFATVVLLGITGWQLVDSRLPISLIVVEIEVVGVAAVMLEITIRLRHVARVGPSIAALIQGLTSVALCTLILGLSAPSLTHPIPLIVLGFVAVLLTVDPSARPAALWTILLASCAGVAGVWWRGGWYSPDGIKELISALVGFAQNYFGSGEGGLISRERQRKLLRQTADLLRRSMSEIDKGEEFVAEDLRAAGQSLGRLLGRVDVEDILDTIFREFCIGK